jgi:hypothetical protein
MVYFDKMVASLKVNGKFLRDKDSVIKLPFGSEYSLFLKNMESRDSVVKISIDGEDVLDDNQLIIKGNSSLELEGFMKNRVVKNKFKFIELTKEVEEHRGIKSEDSLIRIEFRFQKSKPIIQETIIRPYWEYKPWGYWQPYYWYPNSTITSYGTCTINNTSNVSNTTYSVKTASCFVNNSATIKSPQFPTQDFCENDLGITVKGQEIRQDFYEGYIGELEDVSHVIVLRLSGYKINDSKVESIVTTDSKIECISCGMICKSSSKYCSRCGTYLS